MMFAGNIYIAVGLMAYSSSKICECSIQVPHFNIDPSWFSDTTCPQNHDALGCFRPACYASSSACGFAFLRRVGNKDAVVVIRRQISQSIE
jgi:hypothetical protein